MSEYRIRQFVDLDAARADSASRTIPAVIASEHPVQRDGFAEVLSCTPAAVDLSRAPLPVLEQHNTGRVNIAVAENLRIEGGKVRADIRFGSTPRALELFNDAAAGIVRGLSVGYHISNYQERGNTVLVTQWQPHEVSVVSVPADPKSGFFRSHSTMTDQTQTATDNDDVDTLDLSKMTRSQRKQFHAAGAAERERIRAIQSLFEHGSAHYRLYDTDDQGRTPEQAFDDFIENGTGIEGVRAWLKANSRGPEPLPAIDTTFRLSTRLGYGNDGSRRRNWVNSWGMAACEPAFQQIHITPAPVQSINSGKSSIVEHFGNAQRAYEAGLWIRGALLGDSMAQQALQMRGMNTIQSSAGGVLIPDQLSSAIISLANEYGIARRYARQWPMSSNTLSIPRRTSGVTGHFIAENAELPDTKMTLDAVNLVAKKYACMVRWSTELAEDAVIDIASLLAEEIAREFARIEDETLFNGDATSTYGGISGILPGIVSTAGALTAATNHDTFGEVDNADLVATMAKLPSWARQGASWFVSPTAADQIFQRIGGEAGGVSMIELGGVLMTQYAGHPIVVVESMPVADDMSGKVMALFGRMDKAAAMGVRRDLNVRVDDVSYARYDQVAIYATERYDVVCHDIGTAAAAGALVALIGAS
ncbi:phage major capsid protein [Candidatus Kaiserbacteria bacterium]|nr:phage major capsid protein [Candidatus Kaiserbacteria bacterium]